MRKSYGLIRAALRDTAPFMVSASFIVKDAIECVRTTRQYLRLLGFLTVIKDWGSLKNEKKKGS
jgi:hypothetical protein